MRTALPDRRNHQRSRCYRSFVTVHSAIPLQEVRATNSPALADAEHPTKRRRLDQKPKPSHIQLLSEDPTWDDIVRVVDEEAPRVGPKAIKEGPILQAIQRKCPQQIVRHLVVCRGMDRFCRT